MRIRCLERACSGAGTCRLLWVPQRLTLTSKILSGSHKLSYGVWTYFAPTKCAIGPCEHRCLGLLTYIGKFSGKGREEEAAL